MINILHVDPGSKENGGLAVMVSLLLKHLDPQQISQSVWAPHSVGSYLKQRTSDGSVYASLVRPRPKEFVEFMNKHRFDLALVHSGASDPLFIQPQIAALNALGNIPIIDVIHRSMPSLAAPFGVRKIIAVSNYVASLQPPELAGIVETIHNGIDLSELSHEDDKLECRQQFGIPGKFRVIGFLGRLQKEKGALDILKAAPAIAGDIEDACFVFGGDGPERKEMEKFASSSGINTIFTGAISPDRKSAFLNSLDIILITSHSEAFCLVALEAMAAGVPLVSYDLGPIRELLQCEGVSEFLVAQGDFEALARAVVTVLSDKEGIKQSSAYLQELSHRFSIELTVKKYENLLKKVAESNSGNDRTEPSPTLYRYLGIMSILNDDQETANASFRIAVEKDPALSPVIQNDVKQMYEYLRQFMSN